MPQSVFAAEGTQFIDAMDTDFAPAGIWNIGVEILGGAKAFQRRSLGRFNVLAGPQSGRPLAVSDTIVAAELVLVATTIAGPSAWPARVERIDRAGWDHTTGDWLRYRTGSNWTAGGGDVATPPAHVAFTSPALAGEQVIAGLAPHVTDALALRGGAVLLRLRAENEAPGQSQWCAYDAGPASPTRPRLRVTYIPAEPAPISRGGRMTAGQAARPATGGAAAAPAPPEGAAHHDRPARRSR